MKDNFVVELYKSGTLVDKIIAVLFGVVVSIAIVLIILVVVGIVV